MHSVKTDRPGRQLRAVIFDLDDTLYDHRHSARMGLLGIRSRHAEMQSVSVQELEQRYSSALESIHVQLLAGEVTQTEARVRRMQALFRSFGIIIDEARALGEYTRFRREYDRSCQVVPGTRELLSGLRAYGMRFGILTNNLVSEQIPKLKQLRLEQTFDVVTISEEVGAAKPDPKIFEVTLGRLELLADQVVMVGDSLETDIAGAQRVGIRSVWLNRFGDSRVAPGAATIAGDFGDTNDALTKILG